MQISSPAFASEAHIPREYTCQGRDVNPALKISDVPAGTASLVLIVDDPDAPVGTWVHWVVFNIPPNTSAIAENSVPGTLGHNNFDRNAWGGPCPPEGTGVHHYYFRLYALDSSLELPEGATRAQVDQAREGHTLAEAQTMGRYIKTKP